MNNSKNDAMKYVGAVIALGGTMLLGSGIIRDNKSMKKKFKKTANKALDAVDGVINGMQHIIN